MLTAGAPSRAPGANLPLGLTATWLAGVCACAAAGLAGVVFLGGTPILGAVVVAAIAGVTLLIRTPVRTTLLWTTLLVFLCDAPQDRPADGMWKGPLYWIGAYLVNNIGKTIGVGALSFSTLDLIIAAIVCAALLRRVFTGAAARPSTLPVLLRRSCWFLIATLVLWTAIGALKGGSVMTAYWQIRQFIYVPILMLLFGSFGIGTPADVRFLGKGLVIVTCLKVASGAFFYFVIARASGLSPKYVTTHADTVMFSTAVLVVAGQWMLEPTRKNLRTLALVGLWIGLGIFLNDRRIAYIAIAAGGLLFMAITPPLPAKRAAFKFALAVLPFIAAYFAIGWTSDADLFRPVASVRTMFAPDEDSSTESRHIENANLARNLADSPLIGAGLGQAYTEYELGPDIAKHFALYLSIPHNAVLGLLWSLGLIGFGAVVLFWAIGSHVAVRAAHASTTVEERLACLTAAAVVLLYVLQAWGDMGTQNWGGTFLLASGLALSGAIAVRRGALGVKGVGEGQA